MSLLIFWAMIFCSALDAVLALVLLKPLARRTVRIGFGLPGSDPWQTPMAGAHRA